MADLQYSSLISQVFPNRNVSQQNHQLTIFKTSLMLLLVALNYLNLHLSDGHDHMFNNNKSFLSFKRDAF